jgi:hypothetical protein
MRALTTLTVIALAAASVLVAAPPAGAKTVTEACKKDLRSGIYDYDSSKWSEDYIITVTRFKETSRDARYAYGVCTISLKYQPAD